MTGMSADGMTTRHDLQAVVFDLGGVLIDWNPEYLYQHLIPHGGERLSFLTTVCTSEWNHSMDAGRSVPEAVAALAEEHPESADLINAWWQRWPEMLGGDYTVTVDIAGELSDRKLSIYALTNWAAETWPYAMERFPFLSTLFEGILVSGEEGLAKPDPAIFRLLADRYGLDPKQTAFIDDSEANIKVAAKLGFHAHQYTGAEQLRNWLVENQLIDGTSS